MFRTRRSLVKLALPSELAANITSFGCLIISLKPNYALMLIGIAVNQAAGAATLVGDRGQSLTAGGSRLGEDVRVVFPFSFAIPLKTINMKLILLSTQDDGLEIFFDPRTGEFYMITVELQDEDGTKDETLLGDASRLAHSVCTKELLRLGVSDARFQRFDDHGSLPAQPSISTPSNHVCTNDLDFEGQPHMIL